MSEDAGYFLEGEPTGWKHFLEACGLLEAPLRASLDGLLGLNHPAAASLRVDGWLFVSAFQAAIQATREDSTWAQMVPALTAARNAIAFVVPGDELTPQQMSSDDGFPIGLRPVADCFCRCLARAIADHGSFPLPRSLLAMQFERCHAAWTSDTIEYHAVVPISGVHVSGFDALPIGDSVGIGPTWDVMGNTVRRELEKVPGSPWRFLPRTSLVRNCRVNKAAVPLEHRIESARQLLRAVRAIRLATGKSIGGGLMYFAPTEAYYQTFSLANYVDTIAEIGTLTGGIVKSCG